MKIYMKLRNPGLIIQLFVIILNPWWWIIIQRNLWIGLLVFILSFLVLQYFWQTKSKSQPVLIIIITVVLVVVSFREAYDESIFRNSALDIQQFNKRHEFYAQGLGKIYTNKIALTYFKNFNLPLYKLQRNFFSNLDPNLYFFASHPRERAGVEEFQKYLPFFLPFFALGFLYIIYKPLSKFLVYFLAIIFIGSFISSKYNLGPILFFPIINFMVTIGFTISLKYFKK